MQPFAHRHDRDAVPAEIAAEQHGVARLDATRRDLGLVLDYAESGGVDKQAVAFALVYDFRVAGHKLLWAPLAACRIDWTTRQSVPSADLLQ